MPKRLRVGIVNYVNSWPLAWGFLQGRHETDYEAQYLPPAKVADALASGELDAGLVPAIELQRVPGLRGVSGMCVAATHEVQSVLLLARRPLDEVRRVALDLNSRTSAALVQILFADRYGATPEYLPHEPSVDAMLSTADAALVIGDPALRVDRSPWKVFDLAAEWKALTGLPCVFALWAVRRESYSRAVVETLRASWVYGEQCMEDIVEAARDELHVPRETASNYLRKSLSYRMGEEELRGLQEYYRRAAALGLVERVSDVGLEASSTA